MNHEPPKPISIGRLRLNEEKPDMTTAPWWQNVDFSIPGSRGYRFDAAWGEALLAQEALRRGLVSYGQSVSGPVPDPQGLLRALEALGLKTFFCTPPWRRNDGQHTIMYRADAVVGLSSDQEEYLPPADRQNQKMLFRATTTDKDLFEALTLLANEHVLPENKAGKAFVLVAGDGGPLLSSIGRAGVPLERGNYNEQTLTNYDHVVKDLTSENPTGRLAVIDGPPGTGKTYMVRALLDSVPNGVFVFVPVGLVESLASPSLIGTLIETRRSMKNEEALVFVIEDADDCLARRNAGNVGQVSGLLNLGDGIIGSMLDIRIVCTTNLKDSELDDAVIRPGRLSRKMHVGTLEPGVAEAVYRRLTGKDVDLSGKRLTVAEVYSLAKDVGWVEPVAKKPKVGF